MTLITAPKIHDGKRWMDPGTILEVADDGKIKALHAATNIPLERVQTFEGVICPGFVNVHCHLELSYMKGQIKDGGGLISFLSEVVDIRNRMVAPEIKEEALADAIKEMKVNGIVALGDIANTDDTATARLSAAMHMHTFVEALGFVETQAAMRFAQATKLHRVFKNAASGFTDYRMRQSIAPHAPYSVSRKLFSLIDEFDPYSIVSIHNQETAAEDEWYRTRTGAFSGFYQRMGIEEDAFAPSGHSSVKTYLPWLSPGHPLLLIHNTYMTAADYRFLEHQQREIYLGLCPGANQYIEQKLPPVSLFKEGSLSICLGTDSRASNRELSIFAEMHRLKQGFPTVDWGSLIRWGTYNGAAALQMQDLVGHIVPGKKPGLIQLYGVGYKKMKVLFDA